MGLSMTLVKVFSIVYLEPNSEGPGRDKYQVEAGLD